MHETIQAACQHAVVSGCRRGGCALDLKGAANPITVVDCDRLPCQRVQSPIADFIVLVSTRPVHVVVVEMKGKSWKANDVAAQLTGGASVAEELLMNNPVGSFFPLLLCQAAQHAAQVRVLRAHKVKFRRRDYPIKLRRCGTSLQEILQRP